MFGNDKGVEAQGLGLAKYVLRWCGQITYKRRYTDFHLDFLQSCSSTAFS